MSVVLALITKNSATKLSKTPISLYDVLKSTLQIPYTSMIVVDASSDETPEVFKRFCDEHGKELILIRGGRTRGEARQIAIESFLNNFSEEWLMFLDDDVTLNQGWWDEAKQHVEDPNVGLVWGIARYTGMYEAYNRVLLYFLGKTVDDYLIEEFFRRGGTHDTLLRRKAIEDIRIPTELHVFEDGYILRHVLEKGYEVRIVRTGCTHWNPGYFTFGLEPIREVREAARLAIKYGFDRPSIRRTLLTLAGLPLNLYCGWRTRSGLSGIRIGFARWCRKFAYRIFLLYYGFKGWLGRL